MAIYKKGADPEALDAAAERIRQYSAELDIAGTALRAALGSLKSMWGGGDLEAMQSEAQRKALPALVNVSHSLTAVGDALTRNAAKQRGASVPGTSAFALASAQGPGGTESTGRGDWRDRNPDGRWGNRERTDRDTRGRGREDPRDNPRSGGSLSNDWAGRAILERYLTGNGAEWRIENDESWTKYMQESPILRDNLTPVVDETGREAVRQYLETGRTDGSYSKQLHMDMENGEGIKGHEYLHGTNADVGDFKMDGTTKVEPLPDGGYRVTLQNHYQWNDIIDPNLGYDTDRWKSKLASILTLGQAEPYNIHIGWGSSTTITYDAQGRVVKQEGYPG